MDQEKTSLMHKYDLEINQLDFEYIKNCKDSKLLEKILMVLRSGEEGVFPDLTAFCENTLKLINPKSTLLNPPRRIQKLSDLPDPECLKLRAFVNEWDFQDEDLANISRNDLPPVRSTSVKIKTTGKMENSEVKPAITKNCKPRSYAEWDKFNADEELEKLEDEKGKENIPENSTKTKTELPKSIQNFGFTEKERQIISELEKNKGNEAFKAHDYEEAILYYTRSLSALKNPSTYNNRAQANIKLKRYFEAIQDCNAILTIEPDNMKALYRRGIAYKEEKLYDFARQDFKLILELDSGNKLAKMQLKEIKHLKQLKPNVNKVLIEEVKPTQIENENVSSRSPNDKGTRIPIEEVHNNSSDLKLSELDFSSEEEDSTTNLPQSFKNMLKLKHNSTKSNSKPVDKLEITELSTKRLSFIEEYEEDEIRDSKTRTKQLHSDYVKVEVDWDGNKWENNGSNELETGMLNINQADNKKTKKNYEMKRGYIESNKLNLDMNEESSTMNSPKESGQKDTSTSILDDSREKDCKMDVQNIELTEEEAAYEVTPFQFLCTWLANNANNDSNMGAKYLLRIKPEDLPKLVSDKLDGSLLYGLLKAIVRIYQLGITDDANDYLSYLTEVPRIKIAALFLSQEETQSIKDLFEELEDRTEVIQRCLSKILCN